MHPLHTCPACAAAGVVGCLQVHRAPGFQRSLHSSLQLPCPAEQIQQLVGYLQAHQPAAHVVLLGLFYMDERVSRV